MARVEAIPTMCLCHALCVEIAPEVFKVRWGCVEVINSTPSPDLIPRVREAVYRCPAKALLVDEG
jgi:ferredoxin